MRRTLHTETEKCSLSLSRVMNQAEGSVLQKALSSFSCKHDPDIQNFLLNRAVKFERLLKSKTYLIVDDSQVQNTEIAFENLTIYGYISVALKVFKAPETISNRQRLLLDGFSAKEHGEQISNFPCYLIGQLARNSNVPKESISGAELLKFAYRVVGGAVRLVGGRNILVECRNIPKLVQFYTDNGFYEACNIFTRLNQSRRIQKLHLLWVIAMNTSRRFTA